MPKKPTIDIDEKRFDGLINLLYTIQTQTKLNAEEAEELKVQIKELIKRFGNKEADGARYTFLNGQGVSAVLSVQERETFDVTKAMDILNALPERVANKYQITSTNKDMIYAALADGVITAAEAKKCVTLKPIEALTVKKDEDA